MSTYILVWAQKIIFSKILTEEKTSFCGPLGLWPTEAMLRPLKYIHIDAEFYKITSRFLQASDFISMLFIFNQVENMEELKNAETNKEFYDLLRVWLKAFIMAIGFGHEYFGIQWIREKSLLYSSFSTWKIFNTWTY